jgi:hypothetical protein
MSNLGEAIKSYEEFEEDFDELSVISETLVYCIIDI